MLSPWLPRKRGILIVDKKPSNYWGDQSQNNETRLFSCLTNSLFGPPGRSKLQLGKSIYIPKGTHAVRLICFGGLSYQSRVCKAGYTTVLLAEHLAPTPFWYKFSGHWEACKFLLMQIAMESITWPWVREFPQLRMGSTPKAERRPSENCLAWSCQFGGEY